MSALAATLSRYIKHSKTSLRTFTGPGYLERFRYFIENSDWDEKILVHEKWIDRICLIVIGSSVLYFIPIMVKLLLG